MGWFFGTECNECGETIKGGIIPRGSKRVCLSCSKKMDRQQKKKEKLLEDKRVEKRLKAPFGGIATINILNFNKSVGKVAFPWKLKIIAGDKEEGNLKFHGEMETDLDSIRKVIEICKPLCPKYQSDWQNVNVAISNLIQSQMATELFEWKMTRKKYNIAVDLILSEGTISKLNLLSN